MIWDITVTWLEILIAVFQTSMRDLLIFVIYDLGHSPIFFVLLGSGFVIDSMRRRCTYTGLLFFKGPAQTGQQSLLKISIASVIYVVLFLTSTPVIANIFIAIPAALYLLYHLRTSYDWHLIYFLMLSYLPISLFPNEAIIYMNYIIFSIDIALQEELIGVLAAFFAFISWREVSMRGEYSRENALRNRLDELSLYYTDLNPHPEDRDEIEYRAEIESVRIEESRGIIYRFFRYFLLTNFHSKSYIELSFENNIDPNMLSVINSPHIWHTNIENIVDTRRGNYILIIHDSDIGTIENEVRETFTSIHMASNSKESLDIGEHARPEIYYKFPTGLIQSLVCRKEITLLRKLSTSNQVNIRVTRVNGLGRSPGVGNITPLSYHILNHDSKFYRNIPHLFYINVPWWKVRAKVEDIRESLDEWDLLHFRSLSTKPRPLYEGLYLILDAYFYHEIIRTHRQSISNPSDCTFLQVHSNRYDEEWTNADIPIENFNINDIYGLTVTEGEKYLRHFPDKGLNANYVLWNSGSFYTISAVEESGWIIAKWSDINKDPQEWDTPQSVELSYSVDLVGVNMDGVIWQKTD